MPLTPEERQRIYEEEKAKVEAREVAEREIQKQKSVKASQTGCTGCAIFVMAFIAFATITYHPSDAPDNSSIQSSSTPSVDPTGIAPIIAPDDKDKIIVAKGHNWVYDGDYDYYRGSVKNTGKRTVSYWKLTVQYADKKGNIVDSAYTNSLETLPPGASKRFEVMHSRVKEAVGARAFVEEVIFAD